MDRSGRGRGQAGVTLLEVMIAMVIIAIVVVGLISGLFTMIRASDENEGMQRIEAALVSFGNSVKEMPYLACGIAGQPANAAGYDGGYFGPPGWSGRWEPPTSAAMDLEFVLVEGWHTQADPASGAPKGWRTGCPSQGDHGVQRITLRITHDDLSSTAQIVKRKPVEATP